MLQTLTKSDSFHPSLEFGGGVLVRGVVRASFRLVQVVLPATITSSVIMEDTSIDCSKMSSTCNGSGVGTILKLEAYR